MLIVIVFAIFVAVFLFNLLLFITVIFNYFIVLIFKMCLYFLVATWMALPATSVFFAFFKTLKFSLPSSSCSSLFFYRQLYAQLLFCYSLLNILIYFRIPCFPINFSIHFSGQFCYFRKSYILIIVISKRDTFSRIVSSSSYILRLKSIFLRPHRVHS